MNSVKNKSELNEYKVIDMAFESVQKDNYTIEHSARVSEYSVLIGEKLNVSDKDLDILRLGGLLHDIGKVGISDEILLKDGKLTDEEYEKIKKHPIIGRNILSESSKFRDIIPIVLYHHERYDGKGYPFGLSNNEIPFLTRIVTVADSFDAMTSSRPYRNALSIDYAKNEIRNGIGAQFDPIVATAFLDILDNDYQTILDIQKRH